MFLRHLIFLIVLIFSIPFAFSQKGKNGIVAINNSQTVNSYTTLFSDVSTGNSTLTVTNSASLSAGDLIYIIQMQGAVTNVYHGGSTPPWYDAQSALPTDTSYGRITAYNGAGNNELAEINSISGNTLTLNCPIKNNYTVSGKTQIVKVPRYQSLTIQGGGTISCPHWDRTLGYGGVIAIEVEGNTIIETGGKIDASALGFRGGATWNKTASAAGGDKFGTVLRDQGGNKGESIAGDTNVYAAFASKFGRGAVANGGGGGCSINSGGGGGSNAGLINNYKGGIGNIDTTTNLNGSNYLQAWAFEAANLLLWRQFTNSGGGRGGYTYSNDIDNPLTTSPNNSTWGGTGADNRRIMGGFGGRPLDYSAGRLFLGGGGGSGDYENGFGGAGADGGGIIYIMNYGTISGSGTISADGGAGQKSRSDLPASNDVSGRDGAGGGGGGGAIYISSAGSVSGITISAKGGNGGDQEMKNNMITTQSKMAYGPGGGGGGGFISLPSGTLITTTVNGGANGVVKYLSGGAGNSCQIDDKFPPNGATKGGPGTVRLSSENYTISALNDTICSGNSTVLTANIIGTSPSGTSLNWYTSNVGGAPIASGNTYTTPSLNATTDYWVGTCPGTHRVKVSVVVSSTINAPTTADVTYCQNATANPLTPNGTGYNWYSVSTGGTAQTSITPNTNAIGNATYYVSQGGGSCESPRTAVQVSVVAPPSGPQASGPIVYCQNETAQAIVANPSVTGNSIFYWGTAANGGTSSLSPLTPSTSNVGTFTYYFSESNGNCESNRNSVSVTVNAIPNPPSVTDTIAYCQNQPANALGPGGNEYLWYTTASGGSGSTTAPVPSTSTTGVTTYYVSQTQNNCESNRDSVKVVVNTGFSAPASADVTYCQNATANPLTPNGTGYNWYSVSMGGTAQTSITPNTNAIGNATYYVSQGGGSCESPRTAVQVSVVVPPSGPQASGPIVYCQNETAQAIVANPSVTGNSIFYWGTAANGGTSSLSPLTPSTSNVGTFIYYFSESNGNCESSRTSVSVTVNAIPNPPSVTDTIAYCQNQPGNALSPSGNEYLWYTTASGGSGSATAPVPSTSTTGVTTYYVSQTQNNCESNRDSIKVVVNTGFNAPASADVTYCQNATANPLTPNGTGYNWYSVSTGGTAQLSVTPTTDVVGTSTYYVSQGSGSCESPRTAVNVSINIIPEKPQTTNLTYCINEPANPLNATANGSLTWYNLPIGGVGSGIAPTPTTSITGEYNYYVTQTINGCESDRDTLSVFVIDLQNPPTTQSVSYCKNDVAVSLTATGTSNLNWWGTNASGSTSSGTAPVPNTTIAGTTVYYVSQGTGACESQRVPLTVTVNDLPVVSFTPETTNICVGECVPFYAQTSSNCTSLIWNFGNGNSSSNNSETVCFDNSGNYNVSLICIDNNGCKDTATVQNAVIVTETPIAQFSINPGTILSPGTSVSFTADTGANSGVDYEWDFDDASSGNLNTSSGSNANHVYNNTGNYCIVLIASKNNCNDTITKCIDVLSDPQITIPNLFTPNGDGINDLFLIGAEGITQIEIEFFDRWGESVFKSKSLDVAWDGKNKSGKKLNDGVYYYIISYSDFKKQSKTLTGFVNLIGD
jgi:gliding motility-associated-like protein